MSDEREITYACDCCGVIIEPDYNDAMYETWDGKYVCEKCREDYYVVCDDCGKLIEASDATEVDGMYVCPDCLEYGDYFQCSDCYEWHQRRHPRIRWLENVYETWDGREICSDCYEESYFRCDECGEIYNTRDADEIDDEYYCPRCSEHKRRGIHEYGYKPDPKFKTIHDVFFDRMDTDKLYFGVELEVDDGECRNDCAVDLTSASEDVYCKTDGSLHEGIEIVTHPCTLEYHTEVLPWAQLCRIARDYDFESHNTTTCGLHIHVGCDQLAADGETLRDVKGKLVMLVRRHWDNLVRFSRRTTDELEEWANKPQFKKGEDGKETMYNAYCTKRAGRYQAVNLTNWNTVEFRLFKGTLRTDTIIASLQLVSNLCHYAMDHGPDDVMKSQWADVALYKSYPQLEAYLEQRKIDKVMDIPADEYENKVFHPKVGDRVKIVERGPFHGIAGTIVTGDSRSMFGVEMDEYVPGCHSLGGILENNNGLWLCEDDLIAA